MKVLLFSGSHPRHLYVHRAVIKNFDVCGVISMKREGLVPSPPADASEHDKANFIRHFNDRLSVESEIFGNSTPEDVFAGIPSLFRDPNDLNSKETADFIVDCKPDLVLIFGTNIIKEPIMSLLPRHKWNLHLGLSPWYRGAATLFWPFYNLEPQFAGATLHQIVAEADAGAIVHQCVPELKRGDGIHNVGARTVVKATQDLVRVLKLQQEKGRLEEFRQTTTGRLYLNRQFRPAHLRVIYDLYGNRLVDAYLDGQLGGEQPKLMECPGLSVVRP